MKTQQDTAKLEFESLQKNSDSYKEQLESYKQSSQQGEESLGTLTAQL